MINLALVVEYTKFRHTQLMNAQHLCCSKSALCLFLFDPDVRLHLNGFSTIFQQRRRFFRSYSLCFMGGSPGDVSEEPVT